MAPEAAVPQLDIKGLLGRLWPLPPDSTPPSADEIADALAYFFTNQISDVQAGSLLMCLHFTGLDRQADVMAACAARMRKAAAKIDIAELKRVVAERGRKEGAYEGGLVSLPLSSWGSPPGKKAEADTAVTVRYRRHGRRLAQHVQHLDDGLDTRLVAAAHIQARQPGFDVPVGLGRPAGLHGADGAQPGRRDARDARRHLRAD